MQQDKISTELSDIDKFEKSEWTFNINETIASNKSKGFEHVRPSDIMSVLDKQFEEGKPMGLTSGLAILDSNFRWRRKGGLYGISGYPQAGKSEIIKFLLTNKNKLYGTKSVIFSPEEDIEDYMEDLSRVYLQQNTNKLFKNQCSKQDWQKANKWIEDNFVLLSYDGMVDFRLLMEEYEKLAKNGYGAFVTDPWNYVAEGALDGGNNFQFLKVALSHMKTFSKRYGAEKIIVEHQNIQRVLSNGQYPKANIRNITGGSMWGNKMDVVILIHNNWTVDNKDTSVDLEIAKSKNQRYNGQRGEVRLYFDISTGHYLECDPTIPSQVSANFYEKDDNLSDLPF
jgi:hypothetical protein